MADVIEIIGKMYGDAEHARRQLASFRSAAMAAIRELNSQEIVIPITINDNVKQAVEKLSSQNLLLSLGIKFDETQVQSAMRDLREQLASQPVVIPVQLQNTGGAPGGGGDGGGATAAGAGGVAGAAGAAAKGGKLSRAWRGSGFWARGGQALGTLFAARFAAREANEVFEEWGENSEGKAASTESTPEKMIEDRRKRNEKGHANGLRGAANWLWDKTGVTHLLGGETYAENKSEIDDAQRNLDISKERGTRAQKAAESAKQRQAQTDRLQRELAGENPDKYGKMRSGVEETYKKEMEGAQATEDGWRATGETFQKIKAEADKQKRLAEQIRLVGLGKISADDRADNDTNSLKDTQAARQRKVDEMRAGGDFIGAEREQSRGAASDKIEEARIASRHALDSGDPHYPELLKRFQDVQAAGKAAMTAADQKAASDRKKIAESADDEVKEMQESAQVDQLESQGKFHEASVLKQKNAIDKRLDQLQRGYDEETNIDKKAAAKKVLDEAKAEAPGQRSAIDARERERQQREAARFHVAGLQAAAGLHPLDNAAQQKAFDAEWAEKLDKVKNDPEALREAQGDRATAQAELKQKHERAKAQMQLQTLQDNLRATGHGKEADFASLEDETKRQLEDAGGDEQMKKMIRSKAEARAKAMMHDDSQGGMYSSWDEYFSATHSRIQSGAGESMNDLQSFVNRLEKANNAKDPLSAGKIDREGDEAWRKAAQKLSEAQTVGVVKIR